MILGTLVGKDSFSLVGTLTKIDSFRSCVTVRQIDSFKYPGTLRQPDSFTLYVTIGVDDLLANNGTSCPDWFIHVFDTFCKYDSFAQIGTLC